MESGEQSSNHRWEPELPGTFLRLLHSFFSCPSIWSLGLPLIQSYCVLFRASTPRIPSTGRERQRTEAPRWRGPEATRGPVAPSKASHSPLCVFHKHCAVLEPAHRAAESHNSSSPNRPQVTFTPSLRSTAKVGQFI